MSYSIIETVNAPKAIGPYSQATSKNNTIYISGQIPLHPQTMVLANSFEEQTVQVFENIKAIVLAANGSMSQIVKLNIFLTDLNNFEVVNNIMKDYFAAPYPARATLGVAALPRQAQIEVDAILVTS
ncbi:UNVERIFIED_CONTAM: hypothetical protein GTU68_035422 [Idotea baltica]|nr:hypothetical protein [Idotea baltica]